MLVHRLLAIEVTTDGHGRSSPRPGVVQVPADTPGEVNARGCSTPRSVTAQDVSRQGRGRSCMGMAGRLPTVAGRRDSGMLSR